MKDFTNELHFRLLNNGGFKEVLLNREKNKSMDGRRKGEKAKQNMD